VCNPGEEKLTVTLQLALAATVTLHLLREESARGTASNRSRVPAEKVVGKERAELQGQRYGVVVGEGEDADGV
jgi:hypothetical protein